MPGDASEIRYGQIAISRGFITSEQLHECVDAQKNRDTRLGELLVKAGYMTADHAEQVIQSQKLAAGESVRLGSYEILEKIGEGGMGSVYKARNTDAKDPDQALVALKLLPPKLAQDPVFIERFKREGQNAGALAHENLVAGYDLGMVDGFHFIAMEYVDGRNVWWLFKRKGAFDEEVVLRIGYDVCLALDHAASHGLVHRDLKPENIMITTDGNAKLLDLGLARSFEQGADRLTRKGIAIGTPQYISPEQARGSRDVDMRSDIYSLGATLYHLLVGVEPFEGPTAPVIMTKHLNEPVLWPGDVRKDISEGASRILVKMMAKDKRDRYQTPQLAAEDMARVLHGKSIPELPRNAKWFKHEKPKKRPKRKDKTTHTRPAAKRRSREPTVKSDSSAHAPTTQQRFMATARAGIERSKEIWGQWPTRIRVAGVSGIVLILLVPVLIGVMSRAGNGEPHREVRIRVDEVGKTPEGTPDLPATNGSGAETPDVPEADPAPVESVSRGPADEDRALEAYRLIQRRERDGKTPHTELIGRYATLVQIFGETEPGRWAAERLNELRANGHAPKPPAPKPAFAPKVHVDETAAQGFDEYSKTTDPGDAWQRLPLTIHGVRSQWKSYGAWKERGNGLEFQFSASKKYSRAIVSRRAVGPSEFVVEFRHQGGSGINVAIMDKAGESVSATVAGDALGKPGEWNRLYLRAGAKDIAGYLNGAPLDPVRQGSPKAGAIRLSLVGGRWEIRSAWLRAAKAGAPVAVPLYATGFSRADAPRWHGIPIWRNRATKNAAIKAHKSEGKDYAAFARVSAKPEALFAVGQRSHIQFDYFLDGGKPDVPIWVWVAVRGREDMPHVYRVDQKITPGSWARIACRLSSFQPPGPEAGGLYPGVEISSFGITAGKPGSTVSLKLDNVVVFETPPVRTPAKKEH